MPTTVITRGVSPALARCELTHLPRTPIDVERAAAQHAAYEAAVRNLGCLVHRLPPDPDLPDSVFVEDAAVVLDEIAIVTRPGVPSRLNETAAVGAALAGYRPTMHIQAPATMDGGDVLVAGRRILVGRSRRTTGAAIDQLRGIVAPMGYTVEPVEVTSCLHLKSAATMVHDGTLLVNRAWLPSGTLSGWTLVDVDPTEPWAANALRLNGHVICAEAFPRTRARLERRGLRVITVDVSEIAKAEGGVTCCSLIVNG